MAATRSSSLSTDGASPSPGGGGEDGSVEGAEVVGAGGGGELG
jgi:hypothetical protein